MQSKRNLDGSISSALSLNLKLKSEGRMGDYASNKILSRFHRIESKFVPSDTRNLDLKVRYWPEGIDGRVFRLMAVIIHEIGHAVESGHMDDPFACIHSENGTMDCELRPNSFAALSWESRETYETLLGLTKVYSDERLRQPYRFVYFNMFCFFYCEEKPSYLMAADLDRIMSDFRQLPFPSLYSLANPSEDFAETWADYWQQSHFGVSEQILYNGEVVADSRDKWSQPAYLTKINFIKNLISKIEARQKARPAKKRRS